MSSKVVGTKSIPPLTLAAATEALRMGPDPASVSARLADDWHAIPALEEEEEEEARSAGLAIAGAWLETGHGDP